MGRFQGDPRARSVHFLSISMHVIVTACKHGLPGPCGHWDLVSVWPEKYGHQHPQSHWSQSPAG